MMRMHILANLGGWDDENVDISTEISLSASTIRSWLQSEQHSDMTNLIQTQFACIYQAHVHYLIRFWLQFGQHSETAHVVKMRFASIYEAHVRYLIRHFFDW